MPYRIATLLLLLVYFGLASCAKLKAANEMSRFWASWPIKELALPADATDCPINPTTNNTADRGKNVLIGTQGGISPNFPGRRWAIGFKTALTSEEMFSEVEKQLALLGYQRAQGSPLSTYYGMTSAYRSYWSPDLKTYVRVDYLEDPKGQVTSPPYAGWTYRVDVHEEPVPQFRKRESLR